MRIYLVTCTEEVRGQNVTIVSHGTTLAGKHVVLSCDPLDHYKRNGAKFDPNEGAWYIEGEKEP